jgi:lipoprotein NlpI
MAPAMVQAAPTAAEQPPTPEQMKDMARCENSAKSFSPDIVIEGCTNVINSGKWAGDKLARAYNGRGIAYDMKENYDKAIADYDEAIKLDPKDAHGYSNRCFTYNSKNEIDLALSDCDQAIKLDPKLARAYNNRGVVFYHKQDYDRAIADYSQAIQLDANYAPSFDKRGIAYDDKQDYEHAIADYNQALLLDPRYTYPALWRYVARARNGQNGRAELETFAAKMNPAEWPYAVAELFLGKKTEEETLAAAKDPSTKCEAHFYIGEWQLLQKAPAKAAPLLKTASETCPKDFIEYSRAVAELKRVAH